MKTKSFLLLLLVALLFTGCAIVPYPVPSNDGQTYGKVITPKDVNFIIPGQTTQAEVVAQLGDQFHDSLRLPVIAYTWEKPAVGIGWSWILISRDAAAAGGGSVERSHWRAFFVRFDAAGRVQNTKFVSLSSRHSLDEQLEDWASKTSHSQFGDSIFNPDTGVPRLAEALQNNNGIIK